MSHEQRSRDRVLNGQRVVVVVPAFGEERHVGRVVATMPPFVDAIVVVDDASNDATSARANAVGDPRLVLHRHPRRQGVGGAIATGYAIARGIAQDARDVIAVMAGDGQMAPEDLEAVVSPVVRGEADYVKGTRFGSDGARRAMGWPRWVGGQVFSHLTALAIGRPITDSQCGYTAIARSMLDRIDVTKMWKSFGYPNDLLGSIGAASGRIAEVQVRPVYGSETSKLRLRHLPPIFFLIGRAALRRMSSKGATSTTGDCAMSSPYHPCTTECEHPGRPARREGASRL